MQNKIYLAGGFKGEWQEKVINNLGNDFFIFNPAKHDLENPTEYTNWDLFHVEKCDILLGYMSQDNPSGYGLALEIGYAKAKNKLIILIDERSPRDKKFERYFAICHESSNIILDSLEDAIRYLKGFI
ncbi:nucleoside 2-deoxyribosyltransferase domain-containing protein [Zunongwangia sp. HGR-M22]|uniref:nucleoside 2-deoxyribosyltransferase domain-containing protein n=1 Tax=Zunongwangia sp. HGR-M22 TaxID=3015168 RepID=UPI0022DE3809|nr:nucleoside 2-deoxyribosyltransferase domain-containing protein [Zunongwangia sp. HGR-M22]WBL25720.1 hypothetical protein PBT91_00160 [Zunongwangia sp. HGR-M22]